MHLSRTAYHSSCKALFSLTFFSFLLVRALDCWDCRNAVFIMLQSFWFEFFGSMWSFFKTVVRKMLGADQWAACWRPLISPSLYEPHPLCSSPFTYRRFVVIVRYLVQRNLRTPLVWTAVDDTPFRHNIHRKTTSKTNKQQRQQVWKSQFVLMCASTSVPVSQAPRRQCRRSEIFWTNAKFPCLGGYIFATSDPNQKLYNIFIANFSRFTRWAKNCVGFICTLNFELLYLESIVY